MPRHHRLLNVFLPSCKCWTPTCVFQSDFLVSAAALLFLAILSFFCAVSLYACVVVNVPAKAENISSRSDWEFNRTHLPPANSKHETNVLNLSFIPETQKVDKNIQHNDSFASENRLTRIRKKIGLYFWSGDRSIFGPTLYFFLYIFVNLLTSDTKDQPIGDGQFSICFSPVDVRLYKWPSLVLAHPFTAPTSKCRFKTTNCHIIYLISIA